MWELYRRNERGTENLIVARGEGGGGGWEGVGGSGVGGWEEGGERIAQRITSCF